MFVRYAAVRLCAALLATAALIAGCAGSAPAPATPETPKAEEKRLTLYTSFSADLYNPMAEAFTKASGIAVDIVFAGTGEMLKRLEAEKANPRADVMLGGGAESFEAYRSVFEPYTIKEDAAIPDAFKAADRLWYGNNSLPMVIIYNKNLVPEAEKPAGWKDLTDPKWQGKVAMADANKSGTSFVQVLTMLTLFGRDDEKGWDLIRGVVGNAKILDSSSLPITGVVNGEYALGLTYEQGAFKNVKAGAPVGIIYPAEGTATIPDSVAVVKGAKHPNNARAFVDWLLSKEGQALSASMGLRPVRADVAPPEGLVASEQIKFVQLDVPWVVSNREKVLSTWKDLITK